MAMKPRTGGVEPVGIDITPMIDIVFQLLSFFMMIINFENTNADERVKLPRDELAKPADVPRKNDLLLNVGFNRTSDGTNIGEALVFYAGEELPVSSMLPHLKREFQVFKDLGRTSKDVTVVIRADSEVPTGMVQDLIKLSQQAEFEKFALKATQKVEQ